MSTDPIVAGTDGSPTATRAIDEAGELAMALGSDVHVVTSYTASSNGALLAAAGGFAAADAHTAADARERAKKIAAGATVRLRVKGVRTHTHVTETDPATALITIAEGEGAQLIVVGNKGMTGARRVLGSVPNRVSHHARCGVLIVPTCV